jgi:hypothetical protein
MALHEQSAGASSEWRTPKYLFDALGEAFDTDVASPGRHMVPWIPAKHHITRDSLTRPWVGFVWANAPFGARNGLVPWLEKFFDHGNGVALTPDRSSAPWWQKYVPMADLVLFCTPKIKFIDTNGEPGKSPAQGTGLLASGARACRALERAADRNLGVLMQPRRVQS